MNEGLIDTRFINFHSFEELPTTLCLSSFRSILNKRHKLACIEQALDSCEEFSQYFLQTAMDECLHVPQIKPDDFMR